MVKFSIVIPTFNEAKYIGATLEAIKGQTFKDYEIIVKDGKSTDETISKARKHADKVLTTTDTSAGDARNQGASHAVGEILVFVDADTTLPLDTLQRFENLLKDERVVGVSCRKICQSHSLLDRLLYEFVNISTYVSSQLGVGGAHGNCMAVRKYVFESVGGFNSNIMVGEEQNLVRRARKFGNYLFLLNHCVLEHPRRVRKWGRRRLYWTWFIGMFNSLSAGKRQFYEKVR